MYFCFCYKILTDCQNLIFFLNISEIVAKTYVEIFFNFGASSRKITTTPCFFFLNHITPQSRYARGVILKSRFAKKPQMAIFWCENAAKRLLFSKSSWKTRKKNVKEKFFSWSYGGQICGQKWSHTKIDHFTKNGPKSSKLSIFHRGKAQNDEN